MIKAYSMDMKYFILTSQFKIRIKLIDKFILA